MQKSTRQSPDKSTSRIKRWMNQGVQHVTQDVMGIQKHIAVHDLRSSGTKSLLNQKLQIVLLTWCQDPKVEPAAAVGGQPFAMDKNTTNEQIRTKKPVRNPVVEKDGGASCKLDENQWQTMDVSLNQNATTTAVKNRNTIDDTQC